MSTLTVSTKTFQAEEIKITTELDLYNDDNSKSRFWLIVTPAHNESEDEITDYLDSCMESSIKWEGDNIEKEYLYPHWDMEGDEAIFEVFSKDEDILANLYRKFPDCKFIIQEINEAGYAYTVKRVA